MHDLSSRTNCNLAQAYALRLALLHQPAVTKLLAGRKWLHEVMNPQGILCMSPSSSKTIAAEAILEY